MHSEEEGPCDNCRSRFEDRSNAAEFESIDLEIGSAYDEPPPKDAGSTEDDSSPVAKTWVEKRAEYRRERARKRKNRKYMKNAGDDSAWGKARVFFRKVGKFFSGRDA